MIDRIKKNEERLDNISTCVKNLETALEEFKKCKKDISLLNKYYGSKSWFSDKEKYERHEITGVKAGVLSEDAVWNLNEDINELIRDMKKVSNNYITKY